MLSRDYIFCKPPPGSFLNDKPSLRFRALLAEDAQEVRFEQAITGASGHASTSPYNIRGE
jgi:hypothetical protein